MQVVPREGESALSVSGPRPMEFLERVKVLCPSLAQGQWSGLLFYMQGHKDLEKMENSINLVWNHLSCYSLVTRVLYVL